MRRRTHIVAIAAILIAASFATHADGPGAYLDRMRESETPEEGRAKDAYNEGVALLEQEAYKDALAKFEAAARIAPRMYEAHTYIGYLNRKLGNYDRALEAYGQALKLKPDYVSAIEYQGEAYLGLNRLDAARFNYLQLYAIAPVQADKLLDAMHAWLAQHRANPPDRAAFAEFEAWVLQRAALRSSRGPDPAAARW